jgi:uncharacterized membrane protein YbhN (UPF0104 family)
LVGRVLLGLLLGALVYAALAGLWTDMGSVGDALTTFWWPAFAAALGLSFGNYLIRFVKWHYLLGVVGVSVPRGESFAVFLASFVLTVTPGKVGEVLKSFLLERSRGIPVAVTAPIVVAERLTDLISLLIIAAMGLATYSMGVPALIATALLVAGGIAFLSYPPASLAGIRLVGRLPLVGGVAPKLEVAYESMQRMLRLGPLLVSTVLGVAGWGLEAFGLHLIIGGFPGSSPELLAAAFIYALTTILGAVSFLPGGLGVTEGSMAVLLAELGLLGGEAQAVAATCLIRLATLWFAVVLGAAAYAWVRRRRRG